MSGLPRGCAAPPLYGVTVGIVTANDLPAGRVKVELHSFNGNLSLDCLVLQPYAGDKFGTFFIPEVGSEVLVACAQGDLREPVVLGCLWYGGDKPPAERTKSNDPKLLQTKGGHKILLDDSQGDEKIVIETAPGAKLVLRGGEIEIEAQGTLSLKGTTINLN